MEITKLVLPVAGLGKRLMPLTLTTPKALVMVGERPLLDYMLEEAHRSGIQEAVLIISPQHKDQFEAYVREAEKRFAPLSIYIRTQKDPFGNGHAILAASDIVGDEPFAVRFCDDLLLHDQPALKTMIDFYRAHRGMIFALERVPMEEISRYGVVAVEKQVEESLFQISRVVEKPKVEKEDMSKLSNLAVLGAYIFPPSIIGHLRDEARIAPPLPDALPWTVAAHRELLSGGRMFGWEFPGKRLDCGTLEGLKRAEEFLKTRAARH